MKTFAKILISTTLLALLAGTSTADDLLRPKNMRDFIDYPARDTFVRVKGASVAWADHAALRRDFPQLRHLTDAQIGEWIIENFAIISTEQLKLNGLRQTAIPVGLQHKPGAFRPHRYDRAAVVPAGSGENAGFVDIKGIGHRHDADKVRWQLKDLADAHGNPARIDKIRKTGHSDGLMSLGEAIAETTRQKAVQKLFDLHNAARGTALQSVESYFIIHLPFRILKDNGQSIPAALYGRQAHIGTHKGGMDAPDSIYTDFHGGKQRTTSMSAIDYGGVIIQDKRLIHNYEVLPGGNPNNPQSSKAWAWGHETADAYARGEHGVVYRHISEMTGPIESEWRGTAAARSLQAFAAPDPKATATRTDMIKNILAALASDDRAMVHSALNAFAGYKKTPVEALPRIMELLGSSNDDARILAANAAKHLAVKPPELLIRLLDNIRSGVNDVSYYAVNAFLKSDLTQAGMMEEIEKAFSSQPLDIKRRIIRAINLSGKNDERMIKFLKGLVKNQDPLLIHDAINTIAKLSTGNPFLQTDFLLMLAHDDYSIRGAVLKAMKYKNMNIDSIANRLLALTSANHDETVRLAAYKGAIYTFGEELKNPKYKIMLEKAALDPSEAIRSLAQTQLNKIKSTSSPVTACPGEIGAVLRADKP
ncbi:MAG: hypothetical protein A2583_14610 [Bdellovibrionales bacterium RIFOXYD1_FULL_53_11]|nr:MAG: hypothetical protein A2583_14610 [Bdellovibrionales bacterium RIFOXYD1_FULL_53_11]